mgnify:CR=1 FL=1
MPAERAAELVSDTLDVTVFSLGAGSQGGAQERRYPVLTGQIKALTGWLGAFELKHHIEIPYRVVINEAVELAKTFGGTDGFKYVNGVLNKLAPVLRAAEVSSDKAPAKYASWL